MNIDTQPSFARLTIALLPAMILPAVVSYFYFVLAVDKQLVQTIYLCAKVFLLAWPLLARRLILGKPLVFSLRNYKLHCHAHMLGIIVGCGIALSVFGCMHTPLGAVVRENIWRIKAKTEQVGVLQHYWSIALGISLGHSLLEEYYWRWFVYGSLRLRTAVAPAALLSSLAFMAHHVVVLSQYFPIVYAFIFGAFVMAGGIIWCYMYERQKSIVGAWTAHILTDLAILLVAFELFVD